MKKVETDYNLNSAYISKRIIGLPSETRSYGLENSSLNLVSKTTYAYDEGDFSDSSLEQTITPIQHDTAYGASVIVGRGNLTSTTSWNVDYPTTASEAITSSVKYNTAGSPVASIDPLNRVIKTEYKDKFNDTPIDKNTYAYPTKIYDPDNNFSEVKYRYDLGANVWAKSPAPEGPANQPNSQGAESIIEYDSLGRLDKKTVVNNGAYTRYEYPNNQTEFVSFSTIISGQSEVESRNYTDGVGRILRSRTENPNNTAYGWTGVITEYDELGRVTRSTIPTEINPVSPTNWTPVGDDARLDGQGNLTFLWNVQKYDWKNRVVRKINTDGVDTPTLNDSDILISYDGCGCAGGLVTTIESEYIRKTDWNGNVTQNLGRRKQKIYTDTLGRTTKTEKYDWNGTTVYNTTVKSYNGRDQVNLIRGYEGQEFSSTYQDTTYEFDGHGRLEKQHIPEQDTNKFRTYTYFADGKYQTATDARGATTHYSYNSKGLTDQISWTVPQGSDIEIPPTVSFTYDAVGNRKSMSDGLGNVQYRYDELSRIVEETRDFTDDVPEAPNPESKFTLKYTYELAGLLKTLEEPYGEILSYGYDKTGQLKSLSGNRAGTQHDYLTNVDYRAWGATKKMEFDASNRVENDYNNRLQSTEYRKYYQNSQVKLTYDYYSDGKLKTSNFDRLYIPNSSWSTFPQYDRSFEYDSVGRASVVKSGNEARGDALDSNVYTRPYRHEYTYNSFGQMTQTVRKHWQATYTMNESYINNRVTGYSSSVSDIPCGYNNCNNGTSTDYTNIYDDDGRNTNGIGGIYKYNAEGNQIERSVSNTYNGHGMVMNYEIDGDKKAAKVIKKSSGDRQHINGSGGARYDFPCTYDFNSNGEIDIDNWGAAVECERTEYQIFSSVLQKNVLRVGFAEAKNVTNSVEIENRVSFDIIAGGERIATRRNLCTNYNLPCDINVYISTLSKVSDPSEFYVDAEGDFRNSFLDPFGAIIGEKYYETQEPEYDENCEWDEGTDPADEPPRWECSEGYYPEEVEERGSVNKNSCYVNGFEENCNKAFNDLKDLVGTEDVQVTKENEFAHLKGGYKGSETEVTSTNQTFGTSADGKPTTDVTVNVGVNDFYDTIEGISSDISSSIENQPLEPLGDDLPSNADLQKCLDKTFGKGFKFIGFSGETDKTGKKHKIIHHLSYNGKKFKVKTSLTSKNSVTLGKDYANAKGVEYKEGDIQSGLTTNTARLGNNINNFMASDVTEGLITGETTWRGWTALLQHEVGNGIGWFLYTEQKGKKGKDPFKWTQDSKDRDVGKVYEKCLFGGVVNLKTGKSGNSRY